MGEKQRCGWVSAESLYIDYHDQEWGVPLLDDRALFEMLLLEGAQAGLSWYTILKKRDNYRRAFDGFEPHKMARYGAAKRAALLADAGIVRNRLKIDAAIGNARAYLDIMAATGSFTDFIWQFVDGSTVTNRCTQGDQIPVSTVQSDAMAKSLKKAGFKFVGTTICYAFMQATGMVNDHLVNCFRYSEVCRLSKIGK